MVEILLRHSGPILSYIDTDIEDLSDSKPRLFRSSRVKTHNVTEDLTNLSADSDLNTDELLKTGSRPLTMGASPPTRAPSPAPSEKQIITELCLYLL